MQKTYERINWENEPSTKTPINEDNLNKIDYALDVVDTRVVGLYGYEERAKQSEENASASEELADTSATLSKSYAVGGTGTREGEDTDNAKYYSEEAKEVANTLGTVLVPKGDVTFEELAEVDAKTGYMYKITEDFDSNETFADGGGKFYLAGTKVYLNADGLWELLTSTSGGGGNTSELESDIALHKQTLGFECKNLLPYPYYNSTLENEGILYTVNNDGTIVTNGTSTASSVSTLILSYLLSVPKGTYIISGCPEGGGSGTYRLRVGYGTNYTFICADVGKGCEFTLTEDTQLGITIQVFAGATVSNLVFKPMLRRAEITDDTYEPYVPSVRTELDSRVSKSSVVNNLATTEEGFVLDARQGKALQDEIDGLNRNLNNKANKATTLDGYGITDAQSKLTPTKVKATSWNVNITTNVCYKYGNLCYVYVAFKVTSAIGKDVSLFSLPYKPLGLYTSSAPPLRYLDFNGLNECGYSSNYGLIVSKTDLLADRTYIFEWVYLTD